MKTKEEFKSEIELKSEEMLNESRKMNKAYSKYFYFMLNEKAYKGLDDEIENEVSSLKRTAVNIAKSSKNVIATLDELDARWHDIKKSHKKKRIISRPPSNTEIDYAEGKSQHFARGLNIYKLLLVCFIGSFLGVVVELIWCLITNGYLESRSGLVYGPFNLLYGIGALTLLVALYSFRNRGSWLSFLWGMLIGSAVEYVCSWLQEMAFGSRSWDYSNMPFNINGRICLLYSVFWGLLGILWIKSLYPRVAKLILKIPNKIGKIATWILLVFFIINAIVTCCAIMRWNQRINNIEPKNSIGQFIDNRFTDERMERIFPNMEFKKNK